jgi:alpha-mannosidase
MRLRVLVSWVVLVLFWTLTSQSQQLDFRQSDVYIVPFSHLDLYWACTQEECLSRGNYIISRAIQLAQKYPDFRFLLETEVFVDNFVDSHRGTSELDEFKQLVKEGRIEIAPTWAAIYQNQTRSEALVRNLIYGKRYARDIFGVDPKVAHLADIPGFTRQYPQLLTKTDTPYAVITRMAPSDLSLFRWKAPNGSSVLAWNTINGYGWGSDIGLHLELDKERIATLAHDITKVQATTRGPVYLGFGTDLWAPNEKLIENVAVLNQRLAPDHFHLATAEDFFRAAASTKVIPEASGEVPSSWANLTTSLLPLWPAAVFATDMLVNAEKFATINYALGYALYPDKRFEALWKNALKSLDHNNDGQGGVAGDERKLGYAQEASLGAAQILRDSLRNIAERVKSPFPRSTPIVVFNPLEWVRDDVVDTHVTLFGIVETDNIDDYKKGMQLLDEKGASIPFQIEQYSDGSSRSLDLIFIARSVPSVGYKTYYLVPADKQDTFTDVSELKLQTDKDVKQSASTIGSDVLSNDYYRITVDRATGRVESFDKELNRTVAKNIEIMASEERGGDDQNVILPSNRTIINVINGIELEENNPIRTVLRIDGEIAGIPIVQRLTLYREVKKVDLEDVIQWNPGRSMNIEQIFPIQEPRSEVRNGIPFGTVTASDIMSKAGPHWDDEVSPEIWKGWRQVQDWVFAGTTEWGFTVSYDHQLIEVSDKEIRMDMLRGTRFTPATTVRNGQPILDLRPPAGTYVFRYSFTSAKGDWEAEKSWRAGMAFSTPLIPMTSVNALSQKPLPPEKCFLSLHADNLVLTGLKKSEDGESIVLRAFEIEGKMAESPIVFLGEERSFRETNLLEENLPTGVQKVLHIQPYEIDTLKLTH